MQTAENRTRIRIVQSRQNGRVKELRAALARGSRNADEPVALEGMHLVEEALSSGLLLATIFVRQGSESLLDALGLNPETEILALPAELFASAVTTEAPQGIAALALPPDFNLEDLFRRIPLVVVAAGLQDPGNMGTLLRSAEAFGATGILTLPGTVSHWNPKALRASSGSAFRLPVISLSSAEALRVLRERRVRLLATTASGGTSLEAVDFRQPCALLVGNEGSGLPAALVAEADACITIRCDGPVESLNAAIATSIVLYQASRQRNPLPGPHRNRAAPSP